MPSADLFLSVAAFGTDPLLLRVDVQNNVTNPDGLRLDASIDGTAGAMAIPTTLMSQRVAMRVYVDGTLVPQLTACKVSRARNNNLQSWEFTVPIRSGSAGYAGDWLGNGVNLRKRRIDIYGTYLTATGSYSVCLISNGIADNESRQSNGGALVTYVGVDRGGRYDKEVIDFILPPGSGVPRDRVIAIAARRAGVEDISLEHSNAIMLHEFQLADAEFLQPCQELADVEGRMIQWDRSGDMIWRQYGSSDLVSSSSRWSFTEKNFVSGSGKLTQPGELITEVTVEGDLQEIVGACGAVTTRVTITTSSLNGPQSPAYRQEVGGSYTANTQPAALIDPITVKVETYETTRKCEIVVYEKRTVKEWFNPETQRYEWNAAMDRWDTLPDVYTDANNDDGSPAYAYQQEQWLTTEIDETWHYWARDGFEGPLSISELVTPGLDVGWGFRAPKGWDGLTTEHSNAPPIGSGFEGCKVGTLTRSKRWYGVRQFVKGRDVITYPLDIWEEVEPANGQQVLGGKEATTATSEQFIETEQVATIFGTDGLGYKTDEDEFRFKFLAITGPNYLYGDDTERGQEFETMRFAGATYTKYIGTGEQTHDEIVTETNLDNRTVQTVATSGLGSYLPAAERIPDSGPTTDTDVYIDNGELNELYQKAYRTKAKPFEVTVTDEELEENSTRGVHRVRSRYLESEDEADWLARWILDEGSSGTFDGELAGANFFVEPGDWCGMIRYRQIGLSGCAGRIEEVSWDWRAGSVLNTAIQVRLYP